MSTDAKPTDGGTAFPCEGGPDSGLLSDPGMSLRDWFAGQALSALVSRVDSRSNAELAVIAYALSDAMLAARDGR